MTGKDGKDRHRNKDIANVFADFYDDLLRTTRPEPRDWDKGLDEKVPDFTLKELEEA